MQRGGGGEFRRAYDEMSSEELRAAAAREIAIKRFEESDGLPCKVADALYVGSIGAAKNRAALRAHGITHILCVMKGTGPVYPNEFAYMTMPVDDNPNTNIQDYFHDCFSFIDEARNGGGAVLVHCFQGKSRSVAVVTAYVMAMARCTFIEALDAVRRARPCAEPNPGFAVQLRRFERSGWKVRVPFD